MTSGLDYEGRLQQEIRQILAGGVGGLEHELLQLRDQISAAIGRISQELGPIRNLEVPAMKSVLSDMAANFNRESDVRRSREMAFLAHFIHGMREKETQDEILSLLLDGAQRYAPRLALFVTRNEQFRGWSSRGLAPETSQRLICCAFAFADSPFLNSALKADGLATAIDISKEAALRHFMDEEKGGPWHAFPLKAIGRSAAVLWAAADRDRGCDLESLCVLMDITGLCVENLALRVMQDMNTGRQEAAAPTLHPEETAAASVPPALPRAESLPAAESARLAELAAELHRAVPGRATEISEIPVEAGKELEAQARISEDLASGETTLLPAAANNLTLKEFEESALWPEETEIPATTQLLDETGAMELPVEDIQAGIQEKSKDQNREREPVPGAVLMEVPPLSEEEKLHAEAKRFARLLASEIKLYNEQRVQEGREHRDIYVRLKRDIDRSREMYEKRVSTAVSRKVDYFHDEIVRVLGDNDPAILGSDYPGPRVES